nr:sigma factor binding protein 1, chloroplastic-like [Ipomoea batatas]GMD62227.1 sigma factor binding protein 1, chloroplastic-like [Ipomoea batatas]GME16226.1 sigma factor binding protein 1, chloroplastic-like [Ipomoea batatas]
MNRTAMDVGLKRDNRTRKTRKEKAVKVVYISTPMKVKTSASRFRSLVQELTGRHSDIARIMENNDGATDFEVFPDLAGAGAGDDDRVIIGGLNDEGHRHSSPSFFRFPMVNNSVEESPTSSESLAEPPLDDQVFSSQVDEQFQAMFPLDLFLNLNSADLDGDILGSY